MKKIFNIIASFALVLSLSMGSLQVKAQDPLTNLAICAKASASGSEDSSFGPEKAIDGIAERVKPHSRWASDVSQNQKWLKVDLGFSAEIHEIGLDWERRNATDYSIQISDDDSSWETVATRKVAPTEFQELIVLDEVVHARFVRIVIDAFNPTSEGVTWATVSLFEFQIFGPEQVDTSINLALNKPATASDIEASTFGAALAVDGNKDRTGKSRWASNTAGGTKWLQVDLQKEVPLRTFIIEWERRNAVDYSILVSSDGVSWETVFTGDTPSKTFGERIILDEAVKGRYVKLQIDKFNSTSEGISWNTVSVFELEVYSGLIELTHQEVADALEMPNQSITDTTLQLPTVEGYDISFFGADYNYVVAKDGSIHRPIVDTDVTVNLNVAKNGKVITSKDLVVTIPGTNDKSKSVNEKPVVIPELREWFGTSGVTTVNAQSKVFMGAGTTPQDRIAIDTFVEDYLDLFGVKLDVVTTGTPKAGDIVFTRVSDEGLGKEGYLIAVDGIINVEANDHVGTIWSTKSLLQIFKLNNSTINNGIIRDYPRWEIRSFIFDVGRKTFSLDFITELAKEMSWFKMNDFQVHLNDNYIFLEDYTASGEDPMTAYSGFRLESDIPGLQSEDVVYSKADFKKFMDDSAANGVNIVPEIDVPAHSLQLTKARPDLKLGPVGRDADHLDLRNPNTLPFVKDIFNEYMQDVDPVFDKDTVIHVGTDEYSTRYSKEFRQFTDDMISYVQDEKDRTVRIWGSLSYFNGDNTPVRSENVQMNVWNGGWSNPTDMYNDGFGLINSLDGQVYIVPDAGYYYNYLNKSHLYNNWTANNFGGHHLPAGSDQVLGGAFALWNDQIDKRNNGISEIDAYDRINDAMPAMASKLWGEGKDLNFDSFSAKVNELGIAPNTNLEHKVDSLTDTVLDLPLDTDTKDLSGNEYGGIKNENAVLENGALSLQGGKSFVELPLTDISLGNSIQFSIKQDVNVDLTSEQVLFENGDTKIKMNQRSSAQYESSGKLGFSREGMDYEFDYTLPKGEWVNITITTKQHVSSLYVNGEKVDEIVRVRVGSFYTSMNSSLLIPLNKIGSDTDSFTGLVKDIKVVAGEKANGPYEEEIMVDKSVLRGLVTPFIDNDGSAYTPESFEIFTPILNRVILVLDDVDATQVEVDAAVVDITAAIEALVEKEAEVPVDTSALTDAIDAAEAIDTEGYTPETVDVLKAALAQAKLVLANPDATQAEVDAATETLTKAIEDLVEIEEETPINTSELTDAIDAAEAIDTEGYTPETVDVLKAALAQAKLVLANPDATQAEVDAATETLTKAIEDLVEIVEETPIDTSELEEAIAKAEAIDADKYTEESIEALNKVITRAKELLANDNLTENDITAMLAELDEAISNLVLVKPVEPVDPEKPTDPEKPVEPVEPVDPVEPEKPGKPLPPTGVDSNSMLLLSGVLTLSLGAVLLVLRKKRQEDI